MQGHPPLVEPAPSRHSRPPTRHSRESGNPGLGACRGTPLSWNPSPIVTPAPSRHSRESGNPRMGAGRGKPPIVTPAPSRHSRESGNPEMGTGRGAPPIVEPEPYRQRGLPPPLVIPAKAGTQGWEREGAPPLSWNPSPILTNISPSPSPAFPSGQHPARAAAAATPNPVPVNGPRPLPRTIAKSFPELSSL